MSVAYAVRSHCRKLAKLGSLFRRHFNSSKCKTWAKMTIARIKLLRNKRETVVRQMRRDVAAHLQSGQDATARIRVEHVIREQNMMAANEILELFCERIVSRLSIIAKQRECPTDLKEAISSLIFAGPRCSDIPELLSIRDIFQKKYGKDFVSAATDLRPNSGVNRLLIEKLSALNPPGELKLKVMKEIAKEYQVNWDTTETEMELLKPPEERIEGPRKFVSATSFPINHEIPPSTEAPKSATRLSGGGMTFQDSASAAKAAADSAKDAIAAAQAAAQLAQMESSRAANHANSNRAHLENPTQTSRHYHVRSYERSQSLRMGPNYSENAETRPPADMDFNRRRHSYNVGPTHTDIKFDDSDYDEDEETEFEEHKPSNAKPSCGSAAHPKLPDYDVLSARFEALKYHKK